VLSQILSLSLPLPFLLGLTDLSVSQELDDGSALLRLAHLYEVRKDLHLPFLPKKKELRQSISLECDVTGAII